jgi:hypothetical protein
MVALVVQVVVVAVVLELLGLAELAIHQLYHHLKEIMGAILYKLLIMVVVEEVVLVRLVVLLVAQAQVMVEMVLLLR